MVLMMVFFLSFTLFTTIVVFNKPLTQFTSAKEEFLPSEKDSLIFAWPLTAKADGKSAVTITVFLRNTNGKPLNNKSVALTASLGKLREPTVQSNADGKAEFQLTSDTSGIAQIEAVANNSIKLDQKISVKFE